ncbi:MAG: AEC family transporter [Candidatus Cloacimonetes bacterium]|nr:AEC family transporter [Candidatus Cloacimonadota bacterium]
MSPFFMKIIPLILAFGMGLFVRAVKLMNRDDAPVLLRFVVSVSLPAMALNSILRAHLTMDMIYLPLSAIAIVVIMYFVGTLYGRQLKLDGGMMGSFLVGTMIMNTAFSLPFFAASHGDEGFVRGTLFDVGNSLMIFTFTYYQAVKYGSQTGKNKSRWKRFLRLPPLWAMVIGFGMRLLDLKVPEIGINFLNLIGQPTIPLIMIALGLCFHPRLHNLDKAFTAIGIRMVIGLLCGFTLASILGLDGITRIVVIVSSATPIGFNTLIFANLEEMDREFATTLVSFSILIALFYIPLLIYCLS